MNADMPGKHRLRQAVVGSAPVSRVGPPVASSVSLNEALDIPGVTEMTPEKQIKSDLSKLNLLNNPISKNIDEDVVSVHSRKSRNVSEAQSIASDSKISNYVRMLKTEIEKEKSAKDNALNILKGLKKKDKEVEKVINELSKVWNLID